MPDWDAALDDDIGDEMLRLIFYGLSPAPVARGPRGAGVADDLRPDDRGDRAGLSAAGYHDRPAHRAREKTLSESGLAYETPHGAELSERLSSVLEVVYLIFNEGYTASRGQDWLRPQLCQEALRMGRVLISIAPHEPEGLRAVVADGAERLAHHGAHRCRGRTDPAAGPESGTLGPVADQAGPADAAARA